MSFDPPVDLAEYAPAPGTEPGAEGLAPDDSWLDELDDDTRARIEAATAAAAERAAAQAAQETEQRFRKSNGKWGQAQNNLTNMGLIVDDHGNVAPSDPAKLRDFARQFQATEAPPAQPPSNPAATVEDEITLDPYDDPATFARKTQQLTDAAVQKHLKTALEPLLQRNALLEQLVAQQAMPNHYATAKTALDRLGLGALADTQEFQNAYRSVVDTVPLAGRTPEALRAAAMIAAAGAQEQLDLAGTDWRVVSTAAPAAPPAPAPAASRPTAGQVARAGLQQTNASRSTAAPPVAAPALTDAQQEAFAISGFSDPQEFLEALDPTGEALRARIARQQHAAARGAGRR